MTARIVEFTGQHRFLSNFWPSILEWDGAMWSCAEVAYQAAKTLDYSERDKIRTMTAGQAKRAGSKLVLRPDWLEVRCHVMHSIVLAKFTQNDLLKEALVATHPAVIEEGNSWGDTFWGVSPPGSTNGRNELGKILMEVRDKFSGRGLISF